MVKQKHSSFSSFAQSFISVAASVVHIRTHKALRRVSIMSYREQSFNGNIEEGKPRGEVENDRNQATLYNILPARAKHNRKNWRKMTGRRDYIKY